MPGEILQTVEGFGTERELVMIGTKLARDEARVIELVVFGFAKSDGESFQAIGGETRSAGYNGARIDSAAQKRADRNIADHVQADGFVEQGANAFDKVFLRA